MLNILACLGASLLTNCALGPETPVRYRNQDQDRGLASESLWRKGQEFHRYLKDSLEFRVASEEEAHQSIAYQGTDIRPLFFQFEIRNLSSHTRIIDPEAFELLELPSKRHLSPLNPEVLLREADRSIALAQNNIRDAQLYAMPLDPPKSGNDTNISALDSLKLETKRLQEWIADYSEWERQNHHARNSLRNLEQVFTHYDQNLLRKNSLDPNTKIQGQVGFIMPVKYNPDTLLLCYRLSSKDGIVLGYFDIQKNSTEGASPLNSAIQRAWDRPTHTLLPP